MTTIAFDGKSLAGDRRTTFGNIQTQGDAKVYRTQDGRLIGAAGDSHTCDALIRWLRAPSEGRDPTPPVQTEERQASALEILTDGTALVHQDGGFAHVSAPFGLGSGSDLAIGAMACGKSAGDAVAIAAMFDIYTGGKIDVLKLSGR